MQETGSPPETRPMNRAMRRRRRRLQQQIQDACCAFNPDPGQLGQPKPNSGQPTPECRQPGQPTTETGQHGQPRPEEGQVAVDGGQPGQAFSQSGQPGQLQKESRQPAKPRRLETHVWHAKRMQMVTRRARLTKHDCLAEYALNGEYKTSCILSLLYSLSPPHLSSCKI